MKIALLIISATFWFISSAMGQVGREYGDGMTPRFVTHLPKAYAAMTYTPTGESTHTIFNRIICFKRGCRKIIARMKRTRSIGFEEFTRQIRKNAKKGAYDSYKKTQPVPSDTSSIKKEAPKQIVKIAEAITVAAPLLKTDSLVILNEVLFETNSFKLNTEHLPTLDSMASFLSEHPTLDVKISGHPDNTGNEAHNLRLSTQRAEVVAAYLTNGGIPWQRVSFEGFGSSMPIMRNDIEAGKRKNRRVEILIHERR